MIFNIEKSFEEINKEILSKIELYLPIIFWAIVIIVFWILISTIIYKFVMYIAKKIKLNTLVDKLKIESDNEKSIELKTKDKTKKSKSSFTDKIKVDDVIARSVSIFVFLIFFRLAIKYIWIDEVEIFLNDLINYLPSLFIWIIIWFFGIRFANFIYDLVYHALSITKEKTSKIIAYWAKIIILFFTLMLVLDYTKIVNEFIINTILVWFISMISLAWWLAFWLWWKEIAREILESFKK